jgi:uncharacterized protein (DUF1330 family)
MAKCYLIGHVTVNHPEGYAAYAAKMPETLQPFGARYVVRGGASTQLEGQPVGSRTVVIEFPSREAAEGWYASDAYQAILGIRQANSTANLAFVDGYELS